MQLENSTRCSHFIALNLRCRYRELFSNATQPSPICMHMPDAPCAPCAPCTPSSHWSSVRKVMYVYEMLVAQLSIITIKSPSSLQVHLPVYCVPHRTYSAHLSHFLCLYCAISSIAAYFKASSLKSQPCGIPLGPWQAMSHSNVIGVNTTFVLRPRTTLHLFYKWCTPNSHCNDETLNV